MRTPTRVPLLPFLVPCGGLAAAALLWPACSSGVSDDRAPRREATAPSAFYGLGFDPGLALTHPIDDDVALAAASIPKASSTRGRSVAFLAFTTRARADDGDGTGRPLVKTAGRVPTDANGASDVFLAVIENEERWVGGTPFPMAFDQALLPTFRDVRCERCHGFWSPGGFREAGHPRRDVRRAEECAACHDQETVFGELRRDPQLVEFEWRAPPAALSFAGKTDREVYQATAGFPGAVEHLKFDAKIHWAIDGGRTPLGRVAEGGTVPIDAATWQAQLDAWDRGGRRFSSTAAVQDVVLVSQAGGAALPRAADAGSYAPSLAWEPNPAFDPADPTAAPAGFVHVAFSSDATDLVPGTTRVARDVHRTRITVRVDAVSRLQLDFDGTQNALVSRSVLGNQGGDARSDRPVLSADARFVAFESEAGDLVQPFADGNGSAPDVFRHDAVGGGIELLSASVLGNGTSGNGGSFAPSIADDGSSVAFESTASDLVVGDGNGRRDVFAATGSGATLLLRRVSVASGGAEGTLGDSTAASLWRDAASGDVFVAFASRARGLDPAVGGALAAENVYLHDLARAETTLVARVRAGRRDVPGDGRSTAPAITPDGRRLVFLSEAANLDGVRPRDANGAADVFAFDLAAFRANGTLRHERLSIAASGQDADRRSAAPRVAALVDGSGALTGETVVVFPTDATNLGRSANDDHVLFFLPDRGAAVTVADFKADATIGSLVNGVFTVAFEDLSTNATTWAWDLDGDGLVDSTQRHPQFTYTQEGTYTVTLSVTGPSGSDRRTHHDFLTVEPPSWTALYHDLGLVGCSTSGCHDGRTAGCGGGVFSLATEEAGYRAIVDVRSVHCDPSRWRVLPGSVATSIFDDVLRPNPACPGCLTERMGTLGAAEIARVEAWIAAGAPR